MQKQNRVRRIIMAYPFAIALVGLSLNLFAFGAAPLAIAPPNLANFAVMVVALVLLVVNHAWLMTSTELTRLAYELRATPEEWSESGLDPAQASADGLRELDRRHNAHRNTTENVIYFLPLAFLFIFVSPPLAASSFYIAGFGFARLGYTYAYLSANTAVRGACMTASLLCVFGIASYLAVALARLYVGA